jgi:hypothetical protein
MPSSAEAKPDNPSSYEDVEAHLGQRQMKLLIGGERHEFDHPGNFPLLFEAYSLNLSSRESSHFTVRVYQEHLRSDPNGQVTAQALDQFTSDKARYPIIRRAVGHAKEDVRAFYYAQMIDGTEQFLPPELDARVLRDPYPFEAAA